MKMVFPNDSMEAGAEPTNDISGIAYDIQNGFEDSSLVMHLEPMNTSNIRNRL